MSFTHLRLILKDKIFSRFWGCNPIAKKMTRKDFIKRSGLVATGGVSLISSYVFGQGENPSEKKATASESLVTTSRIHPARETVVRKSA